MKKERYSELADQFNQKIICVIGDLMLDSYMWGEIKRISPEAPVPIVAVNKVTHNPGGAANVGWNIASLNGKVTMLGAIGNDDSGNQLVAIMEDHGMKVDNIIRSDDISTTVKTRVMSQGQQVLRTDRESSNDISNETVDLIINALNDIIKTLDAIIVADYNKGLLTKSLINSILDSAQKNNVPVYVDPKHDHFMVYKNVRLFKPNAHEFKTAMGNENTEKISGQLRSELDADMVLVTLGAEGMILSTADDTIVIPTKARAVHDVSGAGDTVISVFTLSNISGATPEESAILSNFAAGRVCEEVGVIPIERHMLDDIIDHHNS